ncbi:hypothetical protein BJP62_06660 [Jeongeupia sp. USM3]|nr:hypothetical protein BJP62_06660 [Jeongeupia sp. USM3]
MLGVAILCWSQQSNALAVVDTSGTTTVNLDSLPDPNNAGAVTVNQGVSVNTSNGPAVFGQNKSWTLTNQGSLRSSDSSSFAVVLRNGVAVNNAAGATISGVGGGLTSINAPTKVVNRGVIEATAGSGVELHAGGGLENMQGARITGGTAGLYLINGSDQVVNAGTISATNGAGVHLEGGNTRLRNERSGAISGTTYGLQMVNGSEAVTNLGQIAASAGVGVDFSAGGTLVNLQGASIQGSVGGVHTTNGAAQITTAGTIGGGTYSVQFATGNGTLTMQTGALLQGAALGGDTSHLILEGTGTASNDFLKFGSLDMVGSEWTLLGRTEARTATVSNGRLLIGVPGSSGAILYADTVTIQPGTELVAYNSKIHGDVTNRGTFYVGNGYAFPSGTAPSTVYLEGAYTNVGKTILSAGQPFGNTLNIAGSYSGVGGSLTVGALLDDPYLGPIANQVADRMLIHGAAVGPTNVMVLTRTETQGAAAAIAAVAKTLPTNAYARQDGLVVSATEGVSLIQVAGASSAGAFTMARDYVTGGTPYQFKLLAFGPGSPNGPAAASQNLVGFPNSYWDYRLERVYVTAVPLPPGTVGTLPPGGGGTDPGDGGGTNPGGGGGTNPGGGGGTNPGGGGGTNPGGGGGTNPGGGGGTNPGGGGGTNPGGGGGTNPGGGGGGGGGTETPGRWVVAPQVPGYISQTGALFNAGLQDLDSLHRRLGEIHGATESGADSRAGEGFIRVYGNTSSYKTDVSFERYGYDADQNYSAVQFGGNAILNHYQNATLRLGGAVSLGHSRVTPDAVDGDSITRTDTQNLAAMATYLHDDGWYVDAILSGGIFQAGTTTSTYGGDEVASYDGNSYAASIEFGYPLALGNGGFSFEPQFQYVWQRLRFDDFTDKDGIATRLGSQSQNIVRLGGRLTRSFETGDGTRMTPYLTADYLQGLDGDGAIVVGDVDFPVGKYGRNWRVGAGLSGMATRQLSLYAEFSYQRQFNDAGWDGWQFNGGLRYMFGG